ncbi:MAG: hypothetical protein EZS28_009816 [Streblomastix strix]|uniref:Uncharacterized protein n=1 Tax=Streblomastix strix TaxID=222440 RepID=A0A5J4WJZ7_9EUKA|nr:MAG: hypothetical protein EZS28_009816 [Streblomastix strix]
MGFLSGLKKFGSIIFDGITKAAGQVTPTLNKVQGILTVLVSMLHPAIGSAMSVGARMASGVDRYIDGLKQ